MCLTIFVHAIRHKKLKTKRYEQSNQKNVQSDGQKTN